MLVGNNESATTKNAGESSLAISIAMRNADAAVRRRVQRPMDAAIGRVLTSHCRDGRHGRRFRPKTQNTNKKLFLASFYPRYTEAKASENFVPQI
jgi:hypothetical protein